MLQAASEISIIVTDINGLITVFNTGAEQMLGYQATEVVGIHSAEILHAPEEVIARGHELSEEYGALIEGFDVFIYMTTRQAAETREWSYIRKNGTRVIVSLSITAMRDSSDEITGYLGIATDITMQKSQQQQLIATRDQLLMAADVAKLGIWSWTLADDSLQWNLMMFELYAQPKALNEIGLNYIHWYSRVHPEDREEIVSCLNKAIDLEIHFSPVFRILRPDGMIRYIQADAYVERDIEGKAIRVTGINLDMTEQREFEKNIIFAKQQAEQASVAKGQFLANMSHEIRTPLNAVLGMLQLLQKTDLQERQREYVGKTQIAAKSLLGLLNDILDFSKIEAEKLQLDLHVFDLEKLMRDLAVVLMVNEDEKDVEVMFEVDPLLPSLLIGDRLRIQQILINLAGNALKFTQQGQVVIKLSKISSHHNQISIRIEISDTGIGINPDEQSHIFEGFAQAEASTTRRYGGTGLGLVICKRLVDLMGGELKLESLKCSPLSRPIFH